MTKLCLMI